jgi:hypothetical protein
MTIEEDRTLVRREIERLVEERVELVPASLAHRSQSVPARDQS